MSFEYRECKVMVRVEYCRYSFGCWVSCNPPMKPGFEAVFPLRRYVAQLAQLFGKSAQQTFWKCVKKILFLVKSAYFQQKLPFLAQRYFKHFVKSVQAKNPRGNTGLKYSLGKSDFFVTFQVLSYRIKGKQLWYHAYT